MNFIIKVIGAIIMLAPVSTYAQNPPVSGMKLSRVYWLKLNKPPHCMLASFSIKPEEKQS